MKIDNENIFIYNLNTCLTIFFKGVVIMRKMILSFTLGSLVTMLVLSLNKTISSYENDFMTMIKEKCQKLKNQMQTSKCDACQSLEETIDDLIYSLENLDEENLSSKTKKAILKVKNKLENLK